MHPLRRWHHNKNDRIKRSFAKTYARMTSKQIYKNSAIEIPHLSSEQKAKVDALYKTYYGKKISYLDHEMYTAISGKFDPTFIPRSVYYSDIEFMLNNRVEYARVIEDKNLLPEMAKAAQVPTPKTIWSNSGGMDYLPGQKFLERSEILDLLKSYDKIFVKPSVGTSGGSGCCLYTKLDEKYPDREVLLDEIYASYTSNFVVQEALSNCESLKVLHPASLNTFRIITYVMNGEIKVAPATMRMGRSGATVDNTSAGGLVCGLDYEGNLLEFASSDKMDFKCTEHPDTHIKFSQHKIPEFPKVLDAAKRMHSLIPQLGIVNWDFTITADGNPCLIEANCEFAAGYDLIQIAHGQGIFGEDTPYIFALSKFLRSKTKLERDAINISDFKFEG